MSFILMRSDINEGYKGTGGKGTFLVIFLSCMAENNVLAMAAEAE